MSKSQVYGCIVRKGIKMGSQEAGWVWEGGPVLVVVMVNSKCLWDTQGETGSRPLKRVGLRPASEQGVYVWEPI